MNGTRTATYRASICWGSNCHESYASQSDNFGYPRADNSFCAHSLLCVARHEGKTRARLHADASAS